MQQVYRPRFLGQFFELSSCGRLEGKQGLVSRPRGLEVKPFDQPLLDAALMEFFERVNDFLQGVEVPHPAKLLSPAPRFSWTLICDKENLYVQHETSGLRARLKN
jgi:hypothetical protein